MYIVQPAVYVDFRTLTCAEAQTILKLFMGLASQGKKPLKELSYDLAILDACLHHSKSCLNQKCINLGHSMSAQRDYIDWLEQNKVMAIKSSG